MQQVFSEDIVRRVREIKTNAELLCELCTSVDEGMVFKAQYLLRHKCHLIAALESWCDEIRALLVQIKSTTTEQAKTAMRSYPRDLEVACAAASIPLDKDSRHPKYTLDGGFFTLVIDEGMAIARLSDYEGKLDELPADVDAVVQLLQKEHNRVFGRKRNNKQFLAKLRKQYVAVIEKSGKTDGDKVPIRQITSRLRKNEKGFRTDEFLIDLSRLVDGGKVTIGGRRLDLQQTKDTIQGMLLHGPAGRAYFEFIVFRKDRQRQ